MGCACSKKRSAFGGPIFSVRGRRGAPEDLTALLVGLDGAGKSSVVRALVGGASAASTLPTVGFSAPAVIAVTGSRLRLYDVGGGARIRALWPAFYADVHALIFVVDASDAPRLREAAAELRRALAHPCVVGKPLLILATKQDVAGALGAALDTFRLGLFDAGHRARVVVGVLRIRLGWLVVLGPC